MKTLLLCVVLLVAGAHASGVDNRVDDKIRTSEDLLSSVMTHCSSLDCIKDKVLNYLDSILGLSDEAREFKSKNIDKVIFERMMRILKTHSFQADLPGGAAVVYKPTTGLDIDIPVQPQDDEFTAQARGILKKKLLLPILLLLKLKMKALMPIFVALIGLKALKALILSKLALGIVVGFLLFNLLKGKGMPMPMMMMTPMPPVEPPNNSYGAPAAAATPMSSYEPGWEPTQGGPYARIWTNSDASPSSSSGSSSSSSSGSASSAQNLAYSAYYSNTGSSTPTY